MLHHGTLALHLVLCTLVPVGTFSCSALWYSCTAPRYSCTAPWYTCLVRWYSWPCTLVGTLVLQTGTFFLVSATSRFCRLVPLPLVPTPFLQQCTCYLNILGRPICWKSFPPVSCTEPSTHPSHHHCPTIPAIFWPSSSAPPPLALTPFLGLLTWF